MPIQNRTLERVTHLSVGEGRNKACFGGVHTEEGTGSEEKVRERKVGVPSAGDGGSRNGFETVPGW